MPLSIRRQMELEHSLESVETMMPEDKARDYQRGFRYVCPVCKAVHWWPAGKCHRPGCKFIGKLSQLR